MLTFDFSFFLVSPVVILKIQSTALKMYTVSWTKPTLPAHRTVLKYAIHYGVFNGSKNSQNVSEEKTSIIVDVDYEKLYIFEIQVLTQAGISNVTSRTWFSHSGTKHIHVTFHLHV